MSPKNCLFDHATTLHDATNGLVWDLAYNETLIVLAWPSEDSTQLSVFEQVGQHATAGLLAYVNAPGEIYVWKRIDGVITALRLAVTHSVKGKSAMEAVALLASDVWDTWAPPTDCTLFHPDALGPIAEA